MHEEKDRHGVIAILCPEILHLRYNTAALGLPTDTAIEKGFWPITDPQVQVPLYENIENCHLQIQAKIEQVKTNQNCREFLTDTDWKVTRHNEQLSRNIETSLTGEGFEALLNERQEKRDSIID